MNLLFYIYAVLYNQIIIIIVKGIPNPVSYTHLDVYKIQHLIIQVIINLVHNAIKYTPQGSNITLHAYQKEDMVTIEVYDDGAGIPDDKKEHIFDKFYRGNTKIVDSKRSLGLGLALCKSIVHSHGGEIHVMDRIPHGAMFYFTLPATKLKLEEHGEVS